MKMNFRSLSRRSLVPRTERQGEVGRDERAWRQVDPVEFIARHGVVLAAAKGPVPNLAEAIAGGPIRGSWWGHQKGSEIFRALVAVSNSADVLCFRLVDGKITFVHRRVWPALVRIASELKKDQLTAIKQEHTATGAHRNLLTPFPKWVSTGVKEAAKRLSDVEARALIGDWLNKSQMKTTRRGRQ
jgi:hypothetical protein